MISASSRCIAGEALEISARGSQGQIESRLNLDCRNEKATICGFGIETGGPPLECGTNLIQGSLQCSSTVRSDPAKAEILNTVDSGILEGIIGSAIQIQLFYIHKLRPIPRQS